MTKYKTNAQKLKFFNDAKAARMPKADRGVIMQARTTPGEIYDPNPKITPPNFNEPKGPDPSRFINKIKNKTNPTAGELANLGSPDPLSRANVINPMHILRGLSTKGEISPYANVKPKNPSKMSDTQKKKKGGSIKRRKK